MHETARCFRAMRRLAIGVAVPRLGLETPSTAPFARASADSRARAWDSVGLAVRTVAAALPEAGLVLLVPDEAAVPADVATLAERQLTYPTPPQPPDSVHETAEALRRARCDGIVVLALGGATPYLLAYLAYFAGIERRAALSAEFGGGVLTDAVPPPAGAADDASRHLALLDALGLRPRAPSGAAHAFSVGGR